ncbi:MAG: sigma-70 family RNA polymerase sigma factor [Candidatus Dormibacteraeota bacterium]|uniref:Sigma-70 family RNA polymerase sigma factor n=1 Tax=Candidatus Nephthysia bennettiae TaxID=3127016 RepID=A0A934JZ08_9BACT|nr:sigma-70 family RNA polymerase sigma factor [Candidatus Dormibacteraeota bacterium]
MPGIYDFLSRFVRDSSIAEDLAQLTFVRAWEARESLQDPARVRGWLYTIAHNLATNHVTRSRRTEPIHEQFDLAAPAPGPEDQATSREMAELVWAAAASLEPRQYAVLDLYVRRDLPTGEIAQALDVPAAHAAVLVNRAKEALGNAVRYLLVARRRDHCVRLAELVPEGLSSLTPEQRSSVDRHMRRCPECQGLARTLTAPAELFGGLLPLPVPSSLQRDGRDYVLVAARNQRQDEARLLGPRKPYPAAGAGTGTGRRRPSRRMVVATLAGLALIALAVGSDVVYLHRPPPDISVSRPAADLSSPSPSSSPSDSPASVTYTPPAEATPAGDGSGADSPAGGGGQGQRGSPERTPGGSRPPSRQHGTPAPGGSPQPPAAATPTARPTATLSSTPTPTPTPTATPPPTPTPTPQQPGPTRPPSPPPPPPPPPPFTVTHVALGGPGACLKTPAGYRCDFTVLVTYHNAAPGSSISGSLTGAAASTGGRREVRTRDFTAGVAPGTGTASVPVSLFFSSVPCAPGSSASAAIGQPNGAGTGAVAFGQGCTPG